jgi:hypothetical protein
MHGRPPSAFLRAALLACLAIPALAGCATPDERSRGGYDPRIAVVSCLRDEDVPAHRRGDATVVARDVRIDFFATPGEAEALQLAGRAQGAEQIGRALVWVGRAPEQLLETVEDCVDQ